MELRFNCPRCGHKARFAASHCSRCGIEYGQERVTGSGRPLRTRDTDPNIWAAAYAVAFGARLEEHIKRHAWPEAEDLRCMAADAATVADAAVEALHLLEDQ